MRKFLIILSICLGSLSCKYSDKRAVIATADSSKMGEKDASGKDGLKATKSLETAYAGLSCDSLMILLIKSSSIDEEALKLRAGIDSIKKGVVYITFTKVNPENNTDHNMYYLDVDLKKRELIQDTDSSNLLKFNKVILDCIIKRGCYGEDVNYVKEAP